MKTTRRWRDGVGNVAGDMPTGCQVQSRDFKRVLLFKAFHSLVQEVTPYFTVERTEAPQAACGPVADGGAAWSLHHSDSGFKALTTMRFWDYFHPDQEDTMEEEIGSLFYRKRVRFP